MPGKFKKFVLAVLFPIVILGVTACPGFFLDYIQISFSAQGSVVGATITFTATSPVPANQVIQYRWDFGDGSTATGKTVTHIYTSPGTYRVRLYIVLNSTSIHSVDAVTAQQGTVLTYSETLTISSSASSTAFIYWTNHSDDSIGRANLDGTDVNNSFITGASSPNGIAVDANYIYWANTSSIGRANLDGTGVIQNFILADCCIIGIDVDANFIYWAWDEDYIARANIDGTGVDQEFVDISASGFSFGVAVNGTHIFWTDTSLDTIGRSNLDGTGVNASFVNLLSQAGMMDVDATHIYTTRRAANRIVRSTIDGSITDHTFIVTGDDPVGVTVYGDYIYWTNQDDDTIGRMKKDSSEYNNSFIATGNNPTGIVVGP